MELEGENHFRARQLPGEGAEVTEFQSNEESMIISRFFSFSLAVAGCAVAAYAFGRHTRHLEKRQLTQDVRTWEHEGGNLAPPEVPDMAPPAPTTIPGSSH